MIVFPPCKINIGLFITGKREDGFHNLESLFYPIPLCDALEAIPRADESGKAYLHLLGLPVPGDEKSNIVIRAYKLLDERFNLPSVDVYLYKAIPMGAGLGGGSANGAYMLRLLKELFNLPLTRDELMNLAAELGSDCPFFIENSPCFVKGRGELLEPTNFTLKGKYILLINPGIHISTAEAFSLIQPAAAPDTWRNALMTKEINEWQAIVKNDFEIGALDKYPQIVEAINSLMKIGASYVSMSGTGSTCYGLFDTEPQLSELKGNFKFTKLLALQ